MHRRVIDVKETVNQAIKYTISNPCYICSYRNQKTNECYAEVKYKGTCKVFMALKGELLKMRELK